MNLSDIIGGSIGSVVEKIGGVADRFIQTKDEKAAFEKELTRIATEERIKTMEITHSVIREEAASSDNYVRRARPTFLYIIYVILIFNYIAIPIIAMSFGKTDMKPLELPEPLFWLFGSGYLGYAGARSWDKRSKI